MLKSAAFLESRSADRLSAAASAARQFLADPGLGAFPPELQARMFDRAGMVLIDAYSATEAVEDLRAAIDALNVALELTPADSPDLPAIYNARGNGLSLWYQRTESPADLEAALDCQRCETSAARHLGRSGARVHVALEAPRPSMDDGSRTRLRVVEFT